MKLIHLLFLYILLAQVYAQDLKISMISPVFLASSDSLIGNSGTTSNGLQKEFLLNLENLNATWSSSSLCSHSSNISKFSVANVTCSSGTSSDYVKFTIPISISYDLAEGYQIDIAAYSQNSSTVSNPLINIKIGNTNITSSGTIVNELSNINSSSSAIKSISYGGTDSDKSSNITFEVPFKGGQFQNERASVIKLFTLIQSI